MTGHRFDLYYGSWSIKRLDEIKACQNVRFITFYQKKFSYSSKEAYVTFHKNKVLPFFREFPQNSRKFLFPAFFRHFLQFPKSHNAQFPSISSSNCFLYLCFLTWKINFQDQLRSAAWICSPSFHFEFKKYIVLIFFCPWFKLNDFWSHDIIFSYQPIITFIDQNKTFELGQVTTCPKNGC